MSPRNVNLRKVKYLVSRSYKFHGVSFPNTGGVDVFGEDEKQVGSLILSPIADPTGAIVFAVRWREEGGKTRRVATWKFYPDHGIRARRIDEGDSSLYIRDDPPQKESFVKRMFKRKPDVT